MRPLAESRAFPEVGFYRQEDEMHGVRHQRAAAAADRGVHRRPLQSRRRRHVFDAGGRSIRTTMELWPGLLALAVLLNLAELVLRKWKGVLEALHLRPQTVATNV